MHNCAPKGLGDTTTEANTTSSTAEVASTVTSHVAVWLPSSVVTLIVAVPADTAVTVPFSTLATFVLFELHVTFWFVASEGTTVAVKVAVAPLTKGNSVWESVTPVARIITSSSPIISHFLLLINFSRAFSILWNILILSQLH